MRHPSMDGQCMDGESVHGEAVIPSSQLSRSMYRLECLHKLPSSKQSALNEMIGHTDGHTVAAAAIAHAIRE